MEQCPFCRTDIPAGAIVCSACGATKTQNQSGRGGVIALIAGLFMLITGCSAMGTLSPNVYGSDGPDFGMTLGFAVAALIGLFGLLKGLKMMRNARKGYTWVRRVG